MSNLLTGKVICTLSMISCDNIAVDIEFARETSTKKLIIKYIYSGNIQFQKNLFYKLVLIVK